MDVPRDTSQSYRVGALRIGPAHHDVIFAGKPLHLTPTEHALMYVLASQPGRVFSYRELVYAMHGYDVSTVEAKILLKTHIRNIRRKIGTEYLVNVRSSGYQLVDPEAAAPYGTKARRHHHDTKAMEQHRLASQQV
jgi:DNA-binding response OmpR family regulator